MAEKLELPRYCYAEHPVTEELVQLVKGMDGYFPIVDERCEIPTSELNAKAGVTDMRIVHAMMWGSMFGWNVPEADPNNYDENLVFIDK